MLLQNIRIWTLVHCHRCRCLFEEPDCKYAKHVRDCALLKLYLQMYVHVQKGEQNVRRRNDFAASCCFISEYVRSWSCSEVLYLSGLQFDIDFHGRQLTKRNKARRSRESPLPILCPLSTSEPKMAHRLVPPKRSKLAFDEHNISRRTRALLAGPKAARERSSMRSAKVHLGEVSAGFSMNISLYSFARCCGIMLDWNP